MNKPNNNQLEKFIYILRVLVLNILFYGAITFENAKGYRLVILISIFALYIVLGIIRETFMKNKKFYQLSFIFDIALIFILELYSRFQINYFFHSFYIFLLLEISFRLNRRNSLLLGTLIVLVSLSKYTMLVYYIPNLENISQMAFFALISAFVLIITAFAHYHREEKDKKDMLYKELLDTHRRLKKYSEEVEKLTVVKERNRIARDIHDTLGHSMTGIIMEMEMASHLIESQPDKARELLDRAKVSSREGLIKIREVVETLRPDKEITKGIASIKELISQFASSTGASIKLDITGEVKDTSLAINLILYRTVQEALTNSVRHGKATEIKASIKYLDDKIIFTISDNGQGCLEITEGYGLKGMKERIHSVNGCVEFKSNDGFIVKGSLPIGGLEDDKGSNS